jgi:hypothetical protein
MRHTPYHLTKISRAVVAAMIVIGSPMAVHAANDVNTVSDAEKREMREQIKRELRAEMKAEMVDEIRRQILAELATSGAGVAAQAQSPAQSATASTSGDPAATADKSKGRVVRVPYVTESMKREIRDQVKTEVLAQAKEERWGEPGALPEWLDRFDFEGDIRLRMDSFHLGESNTASGYANVSNNYLTRGADLVGNNGSVVGVPSVNTQEDFNRTRLRLRFGATARVSDMVTAGFRIATGSTTGPTSTNQTMGQGFNKYSLVLDRGFLTIKPTSWLSLTGGRIANPFFSTDLVWADDLNFEGAAANVSLPISQTVAGFATVGWFPLRTDNPMQSTSRDLTGLQAGLKWHLTSTTDLKFAAALYNYRGIEGTIEDDSRYGLPSASDYGTRYEYPNGLRQRGNTLFIVNAYPADTTYYASSGTTPTYWGLASKFRELNLTGSLDIANFDPVHIVLTGDYVKNLAFNRDEIATRTGSTILDGKDYGYLGKISVGHPSMGKQGSWNVSLAYRWLGSDAVLDAYTNSDFGMGGTNSKGYILGGSYGIYKNTWVSGRLMASQLIDSMAPKTTSTATSTKLSVDLLQVELNSKF